MGFYVGASTSLFAGEEEEKKKRRKKKKKDATAAQVPSAGEGEAKETAMETELAEHKRKYLAAECEEQKTAGKVSEKKRRRSQTAEGTESHVPSKIRKTSESCGMESSE